MLSNWEDLHDIAAEFMSPGNIAEGKRKLATISKRAIRKIRFINTSVFVIQAILLTFGLASAGVIIADFSLNHRVDQQFAHIISIKYAFWGFLSLIFALSVFLDFVQFHPELLPWLRLPAECHPKELIPLLDGLKSGIWKAKATRGILPDYIYDSEWNILLFSGAEYKDERRWLCRPWRAAYPGDIEARRVLSDQFVSNSSMAEVTTTAEAASPLPDVMLDTHQKEDVLTIVIGDPAELEKVKADPEVMQDEPKGEPHWSVVLPAEKRAAFIAEFTRLGKWTGENARKIEIAWAGIFEFTGPRKFRSGRESLPPLVNAAAKRLDGALKSGEIKSLWLSEAPRPDPNEILRKMLGDGNDTYGTMAREARAAVLADETPKP